MRVDKFLQVSRLIRRRTVAKEASELGRVLINGREAKPSSRVKVGDELTVRLGRKEMTVRVERLAESVRKEEAGQMYSVVAVRYLDAEGPEEWMESG